MYDEDTGEKAGCPYCESDDDCPHLLVLIDKSFGEYLGGYAFDRWEEFEEVIQRAFLKLLRKRTREKYSWNDPEIAQLWTYAMEQYTPGDGDICLDDIVLMHLIVEILEDRAFGVSGESGGPPGFDSAMVAFYHLEPRKAFELALSDLRLRVKSALTEKISE